MTAPDDAPLAADDLAAIEARYPVRCHACGDSVQAYDGVYYDHGACDASGRDVPDDAERVAPEPVATLVAEVRRLRRRMETMPPWRVSPAPTDEEMAALRVRWAFGPERYQADADALIAAVLQGRQAVDDARREGRESMRAEAVAACVAIALRYPVSDRAEECAEAVLALPATRGG